MGLTVVVGSAGVVGGDCGAGVPIGTPSWSRLGTPASWVGIHRVCTRPNTSGATSSAAAATTVGDSPLQLGPHPAATHSTTTATSPVKPRRPVFGVLNSPPTNRFRRHLVAQRVCALPVGVAPPPACWPGAGGRLSAPTVRSGDRWSPDRHRPRLGRGAAWKSRSFTARPTPTAANDRDHQHIAAAGVALPERRVQTVGGPTRGPSPTTTAARAGPVGRHASTSSSTSPSGPSTRTSGVRGA